MTIKISNSALTKACHVAASEAVAGIGNKETDDRSIVVLVFHSSKSFEDLSGKMVSGGLPAMAELTDGDPVMAHVYRSMDCFSSQNVIAHQSLTEKHASMAC